MALTIHIVSQQARAMGAAASYHFAESGGTIGRIDGNDWILPDADRFVSSRHAKVSYEGGMWYLTDVSTNGTFVNDPGFLIGNGHTVPLNDGDRLYIGDYELSVSVTSATTTGPGPAMSGANTGSFDSAGQQGHSVPGAVSDPFAPDAGPSLDPMDFMNSGDSGPYGPPASPAPSPQIPAGGVSFDAPPELDPLAAFEPPDLSASEPPQQQWLEGTGATPDHVSPLDQHFNPPHADTGVIPDDWIDETLFPNEPSAAPAPESAPTPGVTPIPGPPPTPGAAPIPGVAPTPMAPPPYAPPPERAAPVPAVPPTPSPSGVYPQPTGVHLQPQQDPTMQQPAPFIDAGSAEGLERLLAAAGVDPGRMPPQAANAIFQLAGSVFREVVEGIMEVLRARDELKSELRISRTVIQSAKNNPLKFSVSTDEALTKLLFPQEHGYMAPVEALREAIEDIKAHQMAMMAGLSASLTSILEQFDPEELEDRFQKTLKHSPMAALRGKSKYWEMFEDHYKQISLDAKSDILALYGDEFAKAYQDQIDKLS